MEHSMQICFSLSFYYKYFAYSYCLVQIWLKLKDLKEIASPEILIELYTLKCDNFAI